MNRAKTEAYRSINDNSRISSPHKRKSKKNQPQSNSISFVDDSTSSPDKYRNNLPIPLSTALPTAHETSFTRSRLATARKSSISFARQPVNMIRPRKRLQSIQGVDNDKNFHFDANQVVLRRNSAINLGMVYDHLYQKLQQDVIDVSHSAPCFFISCFTNYCVHDRN